MGKYCDPKELESVWWLWILTYRNPQLEGIRDKGLLWTLENGKELRHCVASTSPYAFTTSGSISFSDLDGAYRASFYPLDVSLTQKLSRKSYQQEKCSDELWNSFTSIVYDICCGISLKFKPASEDIKNELIHEAFINTITKIRRGKLEFKPGKAPAFNLLTTAIFRIMYSIKNKEKRDRDHRNRFTEKLLCGEPLPDFNSVHVSQSLIGQCQH